MAVVTRLPLPTAFGGQIASIHDRQVEQGRRRRDFGGLAGVICRCDRCEVGDLEGLGDEGDSGCGGQAAWTEYPSHARTTHYGDDFESNSPVTHRP